MGANYATGSSRRMVLGTTCRARFSATPEKDRDHGLLIGCPVLCTGT